MASDNWSEWRQHVLSTIEDFNEMKKDVSQIQGDVREISQNVKAQSQAMEKLMSVYMSTQADIAKSSISTEALQKNNDDKEVRLRALEKDSTSSGTKWSVASSLVTALVAGLVSLIVGLVTK